MRKIFALLTVFVLALFLVSCSADTSQVDTYLSPNKIVYTNEELVNNKPNVSLNDFDFFSITANQSASLVPVATTEVTLVDLGNGIFEVTVRGLKYQVYVYDENAANLDAIAVSALSSTYGLESDADKVANVSKLFYTTIANQVDLNGIKVISAKFGATSQTDAANVIVTDAKDHLTTPEGYEENIFKINSKNLLTFSLDASVPTVFTILNTNVKPIDNQLPINTKMENSWIGYVWDWIFIIPISFLMQFFASLGGINSFALGIFFATIIVRTIAWPIYARANDMSMKMSLAQPEMNKLQSKYAMKKDPASQQKMQMEMMAIYKKHKISILGCFTPILQMPIFLAMFQTVYRITAPGGMYLNQISNKTLLFGLVDLTAGGWNDPSSYVLAAIVGVTMWLLQTLSTKKPSYAKNTGTQVKSEQALQTEKTMKTVSTVMIGMMVLTTLTSVNALGFYWIIGNIFSIAQSLINRKLSEKKFEKTKSTQSIV